MRNFFPQRVYEASKKMLDKSASIKWYFLTCLSSQNSSRLPDRYEHDVENDSESSNANSEPKSIFSRCKFQKSSLDEKSGKSTIKSYNSKISEKLSKLSLALSIYNCLLLTPTVSSSATNEESRSTYSGNNYPLIRSLPPSASTASLMRENIRRSNAYKFLSKKISMITSFPVTPSDFYTTSATGSTVPSFKPAQQRSSPRKRKRCTQPERTPPPNGAAARIKTSDALGGRNTSGSQQESVSSIPSLPSSASTPTSPGLSQDRKQDKESSSSSSGGGRNSVDDRIKCSKATLETVVGFITHYYPIYFNPNSSDALKLKTSNSSTPGQLLSGNDRKLSNDICLLQDARIKPTLELQNVWGIGVKTAANLVMFGIKGVKELSVDFCVLIVVSSSSALICACR